jgi:uncharacterized protein YjaG (DUF416 family)
MSISFRYPQREKFDFTEYLAWLERQLATLPLLKGIAFSCCCCERLYPEYGAHANACDMPDRLRGMIDQLWAHVLRAQLTSASLDTLIAQCETIELVEDEEHWNDAIDAVDATLLTLRACQENSAIFLARSANCCLNRVNRAMESRIMRGDSYILTPSESHELSTQIARTPQFQEELDKQERQLEFLEANTPRSTHDRTKLLNA